MPYYRSFRPRMFGRYRRPYRRFGRRRFATAGNIVRRNFAAASAQRDIARFTLKYSFPVQLSISATETEATSAIVSKTVLSQSPQYQAFSGMFDQVKVNGMRVRMVPSYQVSSDSAARPTLVYAWDRSGGVENASTRSFLDIASYGSAVSRTIGISQSNVFTTSVYATDIWERSAYSTTEAIPNYDVADNTNALKPFLPILLVGIKLPASPAATFTFAYDAEISFDLTFRGVRFTGATP